MKIIVAFFLSILVILVGGIGLLAGFICYGFALGFIAGKDAANWATDVMELVARRSRK